MGFVWTIMFKGSSSVCRWNSNAYLSFLVALLTGSTSAYIVPQTITAYVTETVILPCRITVSGELPTVEWSKEGLSGNITLLYRDGCETFGMKNSAFRYRTNLVLNELKNGNISQIIYNLRLSDGGRYLCRTLRGKEWQVHATVVLFVGSVSEPRLTVVPTTTADGGVTLDCKAECWYPEPEIMLLDDEGNEIKAENPTRTPVSTECFTVTRRAKVQTTINRVTCRVHETRLNQTKNTEIYIPDHWMGSCTNTAIITGILTFILTCLITCGITFLIHKKFWGVKQNPCPSGSEDVDEGVQNPDFETKDGNLSKARTDKEKLKSNRSGISQQDPSPPNSGLAVSRQEESPSPQKMDRSKTCSPSTSKGHTLPHRTSFHRSLSNHSKTTEDSESLLDKPQSYNS